MAYGKNDGWVFAATCTKTNEYRLTNVCICSTLLFVHLHMSILVLWGKAAFRHLHRIVLAHHSFYFKHRTTAANEFYKISFFSLSAYVYADESASTRARAIKVRMKEQGACNTVCRNFVVGAAVASITEWNGMLCNALCAAPSSNFNINIVRWLCYSFT